MNRNQYDPSCSHHEGLINAAGFAITIAPIAYVLIDNTVRAVKARKGRKAK